MKAAVTKDIKTVSVEEKAMPEPKATQVRVRVLYSGICGGDIRVYNGTFPYLNYPITNGHEFCGIVDSVGADVTMYKPGDYVTAEPIIPCKSCYACSIGKINCCSSLKVLGIHVDGCFAEYLCVEQDRVYKIPDHIAPIDAVTIEPYSIGMHALKNRLKLETGEPVLILGAGPIGISAVDIAKSMGCKVMISDMIDTRLEVAKKLGVDKTVNPSRDNVVEEVMKFTNGMGFPVILEATGVPQVMQSTQDYVANGGRICLAGVTDKTFEFRTMSFCNKEVTVLGTRNSTYAFQNVINLMDAGKLHPEIMRSHVFELDDFKDAIELAANNPADVCKVVLHISDK